MPYGDMMEQRDQVMKGMIKKRLEYRTKLVGDLNKEKDSYMVPLRDEYGNIADFRYMISHALKASIFEPKEDIAQVLGATATTAGGSCE